MYLKKGAILSYLSFRMGRKTMKWITINRKAGNIIAYLQVICSMNNIRSENVYNE